MKSLIPSAIALALVSSMSQASLVAYYTFDDGTVTDLSGNGNNGTIVGGVSSSTDVFDNLTESTHSLFFDGGTSRVNIAHSSSLAFTTGVLTVSFWMKADSSFTEPWLRVITKGNDPGFALQRSNATADGRLRVDTTTQNNQESSNLTVWDGNWHHVVFTLDNGTRYIWVDGSIASMSTYNGTDFASTSQLILGDTDAESNRQFRGWMDELAIWNHAISEEEIADLYEGKSPLLIPEPSSLMLGLLSSLLMARRHRN